MQRERERIWNSQRKRDVLGRMSIQLMPRTLWLVGHEAFHFALGVLLEEIIYWASYLTPL